MQTSSVQKSEIPSPRSSKSGIGEIPMAKLLSICGSVKQDSKSSASKLQWWDRYWIIVMDSPLLKGRKQKVERSHLSWWVSKFSQQNPLTFQGLTVILFVSGLQLCPLVHGFSPSLSARGLHFLPSLPCLGLCLCTCSSVLGVILYIEG